MTELNINIERVSAAEQVARGLSEAIVHGTFLPGTPLRENSLAAQLRVSRNTIREAVRILERGGLVRYEFNRGAIVAEPSAHKALEIYVARQVLEGAAVSQPHASESIAAVRRAFDELSVAAQVEEPADIVAHDIAFHRAVVGLLGSKRIEEFFEQLANEIHFYLTVMVIEGDQQERGHALIAQHQPIMDALESGDNNAAYQAVVAHLDANSKRVVSVLEKRSSSI